MPRFGLALLIGAGAGPVGGLGLGDAALHFADPGLCRRR